MPIIHHNTNNSDDFMDKILEAMKRDVEPCESFYEYACGNWVENNPIPAERITWSRSFSKINEAVEGQLKTLLVESRGKRENVFYSSCMDEKRIDEKKLGPISPLLDMIDHGSRAIQKEWLGLAGDLYADGISTLVSVGVEVDPKDPERYILTFSQGGLGLPDREYYFESRYSEIKKQYPVHIKTMLASVANDTNLDQIIEKVVEFETELATVSLKREEMRDPYQMYNNMSVIDMIDMSNLPWLDFINVVLSRSGLPEFSGTDQVNVEVPKFIKRLPELLAQTDPAVLKAYFKFHTLHSLAVALPSEFRDATFEFYSKLISGQEKPLERWKKCVGLTDVYLPDLVGRLYTDIYFDEGDKSLAQEIVVSIKNSFKHRLDNNTWMDNRTKDATLDKLGKIQTNIGYPDTWRKYEGVEFNTDFLNNTQIIRREHIKIEFKRLGKPVDRSEWSMSAPTVNAYYDPTLNTMVFPAGILQNPFFDSRLPYAVNMGGMGAVVGHELTHGFDDEGRKYDGKGRLHEWWTPEVSQKFEQVSQCVADQFTKYPVPDTDEGTFVNGKLTLGENIADLGGLKTAYYAMKEHQKTRSPEDEAREFPLKYRKVFHSEERLFFIAYAQVWCENITPSERRNRATDDPHSPPELRVKGPLSNFDKFAEAFNCEADSEFNPTNKCVIW